MQTQMYSMKLKACSACIVCVETCDCSYRRSHSLQSQDGLRKMPRLPSLTPQGGKNMWIRTALFEKVLDKIVLFLVENGRCVEEGP